MTPVAKPGTTYASCSAIVSQVSAFSKLQNSSGWLIANWLPASGRSWGGACWKAPGGTNCCSAGSARFWNPGSAAGGSGGPAGAPQLGSVRFGLDGTATGTGTGTGTGWTFAVVWKPGRVCTPVKGWTPVN